MIGGKDYTLTNEEWMFPAEKPSLTQTKTKHHKIGPLGPQSLVQLNSMTGLTSETFAN